MKAIALVEKGSALLPGPTDYFAAIQTGARQRILRDCAGRRRKFTSHDAAIAAADEAIAERLGST